MEKHCPDCNQTKPITDFYKARYGHQRRCKRCHNANRLNYKSSYKKKATGYDKLPQETQLAILEDLKNKKKKSVICRTYDIKYITFQSWFKRGILQR